MIVAAILNYVKKLSWQNWLMIAALLVVLTLVGTCTTNKVIDWFGDNKQVQENNKDRELRENLSVNRLETETKISNEERQLNAELAKIPDGVPSARRLARACNELRDRGYVPLPTECRPEEN